MLKIFYTLLILPFCCFAQVTITGRVLNQADTKPIADASVFLSNASVGNKTNNDGTFTLRNAKPGKYDLIVSIIGFETYRQSITVRSDNIILQDIMIFPKAILLNEVKIKAQDDPNRERNYEWFKDEFLGSSERADLCKILNPGALVLDYDDRTNILTAASDGFLEIENDALGYRIKYLLTNFTMDNKDIYAKKVHYEGSALFEELKGTPGQKKRWQRRRQEVYEGSITHFLRSVINNNINQSGFSVIRVSEYANPARPNDTIIDAKIRLFKKLKSRDGNGGDSLAYWEKKEKLPKTIEKIMPSYLSKDAILKSDNHEGLFSFGPANENDKFYIAYNKNHHFRTDLRPGYLNRPLNTAFTLLTFDSPNIYFDNNGTVINPNNLTLLGLWTRNRIAELLPADYEPPDNTAGLQQETFSAKIDSTLKKYLAVHCTEKAYLQFDKPYYAAGDTIYFKAYVTDYEMHRLSGLSGVLHVDFINPGYKIEQSIKLQLDSGICWGDFALPDTLSGGNYSIRAYTQLMRNGGNDDIGFFNKIIPVGAVTIGAVKSTTVSLNLTKQPRLQLNLQPDMQFFPEGGSLVTGIRSKVAFKSVGPDGLGLNVNGIVVDNTGKEVVSFESAHLGMGYFYIRPEEGKSYRAKLMYANGLHDLIALPNPESTGITLSVNNDSLPKAVIRIEAAPAFYKENKNKDFTLIIYSNGGLLTSVTCELDSSLIRLDILKRKLPTGIATVTLFSPKNEPLCERLLFIQNYEQLTIHIKSDKDSYAGKEKVSLNLNAINRKSDPAEGHFSVSVINESKIPERENNAGNITSYLLLTSDLKGYIEQPDYYFADTSTVTRNNLDILMLTQGYRRFEWKQVMNNIARPLAYQPERGIKIEGQVKTQFNKPIINGTISLIPINGGPFLSSTTDDKGMFRFSNLIFYDTTHFVLSAVNSKGKNSTKITWFGDKNKLPVAEDQLALAQPVADSAMSAFVENEKLYQKDVLNYLNGKGIMLKEVKIQAKKPDDQYQTQSFAGAGNADQVMHADEIGQIQGPLVTSLDGRLRGVMFLGYFPHKVPVLTLNAMSRTGGKMLVIIDGVEGSDINTLDASDVETVEVLKNGSIYGMQGADGVLIITTKQLRGIDPKDIASVGVLPIAPMGFYKAREFYSPQYNPDGLTSRQPDLRSTIYWNPEIKTDKEGNAFFDYYNADGTGIYKVVIEGIDSDGNIGRQVYSYKVQ